MQEEYEAILEFFAAEPTRIVARENLLEMMRGQELAKKLGRNFFIDLQQRTPDQQVVAA